MESYEWSHELPNALMLHTAKSFTVKAYREAGLAIVGAGLSTEELEKVLGLWIYNMGRFSHLQLDLLEILKPKKKKMSKKEMSWKAITDVIIELRSEIDKSGRLFQRSLKLMGEEKSWIALTDSVKAMRAEN